MKLGIIAILIKKIFLFENPAELDDWLGDLNPESKVVIPSAYAVPSLKSAAVGERFQFERLGKFLNPLGCVWIKDLMREKEMKKVDDPMVPNG